MAIITNLIPDIDDQVIHQMVLSSDNDGLRNLSGVNKAAYQKLSNDLFFKNLYVMQHPQLAEIKNTFQILCVAHPGSCWKVACCAFSRSVLNANTAFVVGAIPFISNFLNSEKIRLETEFKSICGSYFADPNSPIDKAWKALEKCKQECDMFQSKAEALLEPIKSAHSSDQLEQIMMMHRMTIGLMPGEHLLTNEIKEGLMFVSGNDMGFLNRSSVPHCLSFLSLAQKLLAKETERQELSTIYTELEEKKNTCHINLDEVNKLLAALDPALIYNNESNLYKFALCHRDILYDEFINAAHAEQSLIELPIPILTECCSIIDSFDGVEEPSREALKRIQNLINSCPSSWIWGSLYSCRANGVQEDQWSEKHFHEFLPELKYILSEMISRCSDLIGKCEKERSLVTELDF